MHRSYSYLESCPNRLPPHDKKIVEVSRGVDAKPELAEFLVLVAAAMAAAATNQIVVQATNSAIASDTAASSGYMGTRYVGGIITYQPGTPPEQLQAAVWHAAFRLRSASTRVCVLGTTHRCLASHMPNATCLSIAATHGYHQ